MIGTKLLRTVMNTITTNIMNDRVLFLQLCLQIVVVRQLVYVLDYFNDSLS